MDWQAVLLSLKLALWTSAILLAVGLPIAYWLAVSKSRFTFLVEALVMLPLVLPPTVLGFYVLFAFGPGSALGRFAAQVFGQAIPFSFEGLVLGSVLFSLPFAVQPFTTAFSAIDRELIESSWCMGESKVRTFFRLILPLSRGGVIAGIVLSFAHTVGEFGVVLMLGGNIPGVTRTLSISIYDDVQSLSYASAGRASAGLLIFSFLILVVMFSAKKVSRDRVLAAVGAP